MGTTDTTSTGGGYGDSGYGGDGNRTTEPGYDAEQMGDGQQIGAHCGPPYSLNLSHNHLPLIPSTPPNGIIKYMTFLHICWTMP